ncbi:MAG TPA: hypothetical protein VNM14_03930 [Planctomycetota bacterium]|nr:hypothetical protein [Planctomycetota bacterium]
MSQMEPVFCHSPETLRLVQVVRLLDECLRRPPEDARERVLQQVRDLIDRAREIARENFLIQDL